MYLAKPSIPARPFVRMLPPCSILGPLLLQLLSAPTQAAPADACSALSNLALPEVTAITAETMPANTFTPPPDSPGAPPSPPVPVAFCRVQLTVQPHINIEVWLPPRENWNHRFQAQGGGGYAGVISYSALSMAVTGDSVTGQFATASTDTGHPAAGTANGQGGANGAQADGGFALNTTTHTLNEGLIVDFASRSLHQMAEKAKALINAYYGEPQKFAYWSGCSTGGRQGLMEAQQFPNDYDGILAGAPTNNWDRFVPAELWPAVAMNLKVGQPIALSKLVVVRAASIKACDVLDGVVDGVISSPERCRFNPHELQCGKPDAPTGDTCLTAAEADALQQIRDGARGPHGEFLWHGLEPGASYEGLAGPFPFAIALDHWRLWIEQNPEFDWHTLTVPLFAKGFQDSRDKFHTVLGTDAPDLSAFHRRGGKIITYHGWTDPIVFPRGSINYLRRVTAANGGPERTRDFYRLFMVPGMNHCAAGAGAVNFGQWQVPPAALDPQHDAVIALQQWVEQGIAPEDLIATTDPQPQHAAENPTQPASFTRRLCPFPRVAVYQGSGDPNSAANFVCTNHSDPLDHEDND